jgi:hypothetical protein
MKRLLSLSFISKTIVVISFVFSKVKNKNGTVKV